MSTYTTVARAIAIAVRVTIDLTQNVDDETAFGHQVGKRIQGTYGAELRRLAEADPEASAQDLYEVVIVPKEFPWLAVENPHAGVLLEAGARDRARHARPNPEPTEPVVVDEAWHAGLAAAKAAVSKPDLTPRVPEHVPDPEFVAHIDELRRCAEEGRRRFALDRKARLDAAKHPTNAGPT